MKRMIFLLLFLPAIAIAQNHNKAKGYIIVKGEINKIESADPGLGASASFGITVNKFLHFGAGAHYIKFQNDNTPLVPAFFEISIFDPSKKATPYFNFQIGEGIYNKSYAIGAIKGSTTGGLFLSPGIGVMAGQKAKVMITVHYINIAFKTTITDNTTRPSKSRSTSNQSDGLIIGFGIKI